jgi:hypothetical protein
MARDILIMKDSTGTYYQLDRGLLDAARVPEDRVAALEETLAPEVAGYGVTPASSMLRLDVVGITLGRVGGGGQHTDSSHGDVPHFDFHLDGPF